MASAPAADVPPAGGKVDGDIDQVERAVDAPMKQDQAYGLEPPEAIRHMTADERRELETKVRRKIDLRLLPMMVLMYIMNYLDRNNIAAARLAGLEDDLNLDANGTQFSASFNTIHTERPFLLMILAIRPQSVFCLLGMCHFSGHRGYMVADQSQLYLDAGAFQPAAE